MTESYDAIVIGGGVVGAATAFNLKKLGCDRVMLMERDQTCSGGTAKSCTIVRTHYSIPTVKRLSILTPDWRAKLTPLSGTAEVVPVVNRGDPRGFV